MICSTVLAMGWKPRWKPTPDEPLYRQAEALVRDAIATGKLRPGDRLPSVADLATHLKVGKLTVLKAFRTLEREGLVRSHVGRGTFVADGSPPSAPRPSEARPDVARAIRRMREGYARGLRELMGVERRPGTIDLTGGVPSPDTIPDGLLERLSRDVVRLHGRRLYGYGEPQGLPELREVVAATLASRGTLVSPDDVIVTNGSQQAISLLGAWAREQGRAVLCETPTYAGVPGAFMLFGHAVQSVPWGPEGLDPDRLRSAGEGRRSFLYACPDFHNPTGRTMTEAARKDVATWALASDGFVLDDQIFREMRFEGEEPPSLYSLLPPGRRVLVGSVSKSFMTGLRVGFLAADAPLVAELLPYKRHMDLGGPLLVQAIAAAFLREGYARHLEKMRAYYRARRDAALAALEEHMPEGTAWTRPEGGFQTWVTLPAGTSSIALFLRAVERGVAVVPGPAHDVDGRYVDALRLGYGHGTPDEIRTGVRRLAEALGALRSSRAGRDAAVPLV
jgi:DNA-binding transcriptional MocR family regulator